MKSLIKIKIVTNVTISMTIIILSYLNNNVNINTDYWCGLILGWKNVQRAECFI